MPPPGGRDATLRASREAGAATASVCVTCTRLRLWFLPDDTQPATRKPVRRCSPRTARARPLCPTHTNLPNATPFTLQQRQTQPKLPAANDALTQPWGRIPAAWGEAATHMAMLTLQAHLHGPTATAASASVAGTLQGRVPCWRPWAASLRLSAGLLASPLATARRCTKRPNGGRLRCDRDACCVLRFRRVAACRDAHQHEDEAAYDARQALGPCCGSGLLATK